MSRLVSRALLMVVALCVFASAASAASAPTVAASFGQSTASIGSTDPLTFTITGGGATVRDLRLSVFLPAGLNVAAAMSSACGGPLTMTPAPQLMPVNGIDGGPYEMHLSGASVAAGGTCSFSVPVLVQGAGTLTVITTDLTSGATPGLAGNPATASVTVPATASPATVSSAFSPNTVDENGTTTWALAITNPNPSTTLTDVRFFVPIPTFNVSFVPDAVTSNGCGGSAAIKAQPDPFRVIGPYVNYGAGSIVPGATCTVTVSMTPKDAFAQVALPVTVVSNEGGPSVISTATLTSLAPAGTPPAQTPSNRFTHTKPGVARDGTITETVELPGTGEVQLRETWKGKLVAHATRTVTSKTRLTIKLVPGSAARRVLKSHHASTLKLSIAYRPTGGTTRTVRLTERTPRARS